MYNVNNSETLRKIDTFIRQELKLLLDQCTPEQKIMFKRMYSHKDLLAEIDKIVDEMPAEKLYHAIGQCEHTIEKNKQKVSI